MQRPQARQEASTANMRDLGLGHLEHPLLGRRVVDHAHDDQVGVFRAFAPDVKKADLGPALAVPIGPPVAWLVPEEGGLEWTTDPDSIEAT